MYINNSLFEPVTRDERQAQAIEAWRQYKGHATIVACTGFGKTTLAIKIIAKMYAKRESLKVIIAVPTTNLKDQWVSNIDRKGLGLCCEVVVMMGASKKQMNCDLLVIDEAHKINSEVLSNLLVNTHYKFILGLTATFERLDGRHEILAKYAPVCDTITMQDALLNGWVSKYKDYVVLIDVPDIDTYNQLNKDFNTHFEALNWDFNFAMSLIGKDGFRKRMEYCKALFPKDYEKQKEMLKSITFHAMGFMQCMQARKKFVQNHPEKIRIANEIIAHRVDKKIVTFNANVKMAESYGNGYVYTGKDGKKKNRMTIEEFSGLSSGILHSCKMAIEGLDVPDLSVGIQTGIDSSKTKAVQSLNIF